MKLTLDVENTVTKRDGKMHLDPFEPDNKRPKLSVIIKKDDHKIFKIQENIEDLCASIQYSIVTILLKKLEKSKLNITTIEDLYHKSQEITGVANKVEFEDNIIGVVRYRDGSIIDSIYQIKGDV